MTDDALHNADVLQPRTPLDGRALGMSLAADAIPSELDLDGEVRSR
ncbi:hypothetical protein [Bradyrhizobium sp. CCBAU 45389]|nr:hypothetical protein [Bradyrhizobium sp. CCBAU 45389]